MNTPAIGRHNSKALHVHSVSMRACTCAHHTRTTYATHACNARLLTHACKHTPTHVSIQAPTRAPVHRCIKACSTHANLCTCALPHTHAHMHPQHPRTHACTHPPMLSCMAARAYVRTHGSRHAMQCNTRTHRMQRNTTHACACARTHVCTHVCIHAPTYVSAVRC